MRKWNMMLLALLLVTMPAACLAQELPELFTGVYESIAQGLEQGMQMAESAMAQELTLSIETDSARIEEGKAGLLTITAGNPLPYEAVVRFTLKLPQRVAADGETAWETVLPAAQMNEETGALEASQTMIVRELTLLEGGESQAAQIECEMAMGTRFYRAQLPLALCVPSVSVSAHTDGVKDGRLNPGDTFAYRIELVNTGDAPKDMLLEITVPEAAVFAGAMEPGFALADQTARGLVNVPAAQGETPAKVELLFPMMIAQDALQGDADARRLIAPVLTAGGEQVAAERILVCGPKISARLLTEHERLETGEETTLSVVVVNSGLAAADVRLSCVLPDGLTLADEEKDKKAGNKDKKDQKALVPDAQGDGQLPGAGEAIPVEEAPAAEVMTRENNTLVFNMHVDAAAQTKDGVIAHTQVIEIPVRAQIAQGRMTQQMLGASLAWSVDEEQAQLAQAVALSVHPQTVLGLTRADWNGVFWAGVLLLLTVVCLYAAVKRDKPEDDYCFD